MMKSKDTNKQKTKPKKIMKIPHIQIQNQSVAEILALKPGKFRELSDSMLAELVPVLQQLHKDAYAFARSLQEAKGFSDDVNKAFDFAWMIDNRADIAKDFPKKRREKAEKLARKIAREAKATNQEEIVRLTTPSKDLIMKHYEGTINEMIKRSFDNHVVRHGRYIARHQEAVKLHGDNERKIEDYMRNYVIDEHRYSWENLILNKSERYPYVFISYKTAEEMSERYMKIATKFINEIFGAFAYKIALRSIERHFRATKIEKDTLVNVDGGNQTIWEGSIITTHFAKGSYKFKTTLKWNRSKFDKEFMQFPTLEICGDHENESDLEDWGK